MAALLPKASADLRTIASINGLVPFVFAIALLVRLPGELVGAFMRLWGGGEPPPPPSGIPAEVHLLWFALAVAAFLTSPLLYHGWDVGRLVTVALGLCAIILSIVELVMYAVRWPVIVCGLAWPAFVVVYVLWRGPRRSTAITEQSVP